MACPCEKNKITGAFWSNACIGELWLFEGLSLDDLLALASKAVRSVYQAGQTVFVQGERAQSIFLIKTGHIRLSRTMQNGAEVILDIRKPGDCLGEYILNDLEEEYHYPVSAWCMEDVVICGFTKSIFEELVLTHPSIGLKIIRNMAGRIAHLTERLDAMSQCHLEEKLFGVLLNVAREHGFVDEAGGYRLEMPLTHEDIGFLIGAHRVSVTRIMKRLKETGRISHAGRFLIVNSPGDLSALI